MAVFCKTTHRIDHAHAIRPQVSRVGESSVLKSVFFCRKVVPQWLCSKQHVRKFRRGA